MPRCRCSRNWRAKAKCNAGQSAFPHPYRILHPSSLIPSVPGHLDVAVGQNVQMGRRRDGNDRPKTDPPPRRRSCSGIAPCELPPRWSPQRVCSRRSPVVISASAEVGRLVLDSGGGDAVDPAWQRKRQGSLLELRQVVRVQSELEFSAQGRRGDDWIGPLGRLALVDHAALRVGSC